MARTNAIITASYAPDFERCRILCESIDRFAEGYTMHYLLVDEPDRALFAQLEGPRRVIVSDTEVLPWWLRRLPQAIMPQRRRVWVGPRTTPLLGWQVQQIKRIAIAHMIDDDGLLYCDSDTAFVRPFDLAALWSGADMRLYREFDGAFRGLEDHFVWIAHAGDALGIPAAKQRNHDYITQFVSWKRQTVIDMCAHIERLHGRPWVSVIGRSRKFSECMIYGAYVEGVLDGAGHEIAPETLCPMQWFNPVPTDAQLQAVIANLKPFQVGIGVQSFIALEPARFRAAALGSDMQAA